MPFHEAGLLKLDISKTMNQLDWKPKLNAAKAIEKTISWYKEIAVYQRDTRTFSEQQIQEFTSTI